VLTTKVMQKIFFRIYEKFLKAFVFFKTRKMNNLSSEECDFWVHRIQGTGLECVTSPLNRPVVILHGASVGELNGIFPVVRGLRNSGFKGSIFVSVGTFTGFKKAVSVARNLSFEVVPAPFDFHEPVSRFFQSSVPDLFVTFEAEYWPVTHAFLSNLGVATLLCNGRISYRSFRVYRLLEGVFKDIFQRLWRAGMVSHGDKLRIIDLGADPSRVHVTGNSKHEELFETCRNFKYSPSEWAEMLDIGKDTRVFVAGSLRSNECNMIVDVCSKIIKKFDNVKCILVPRHLGRVSQLAELLNRKAIPCSFLSRVLQGLEKPKERVLIVDLMGFLFDIYALGDAVFCGGSLVPIGGHNIMEPIARGRKVIYGPYISKVKSEQELLQSLGCGVMVKNAKELERVVVNFITNPHEGRVPRDKYEKIRRSFYGVSKTYVRWIVDWLRERHQL